MARFPSRTITRAKPWSNYKKDVKRWTARRRRGDSSHLCARGSDDTKAVEDLFGPACFEDDTPQPSPFSKGYSNEVTYSNLNVDNEAALTHLVKSC